MNVLLHIYHCICSRHTDTLNLFTKQMTCESTVSMCGCVWVSQEAVSWCSLVRDAKHPLPSLVSPWSLWAGYEMLPQSICCLSHMILPHPHPITTGSGISFHIGSSFLLTDQHTDPEYTDKFWSSLPGRHMALLFTHCPSTDHDRKIAPLSG